jgi:hypothetical protein
VRHERGHSPKRGLFLGKPGEPAAALGVRDRRGDQLREVREPRFGPRWERLVGLRRVDEERTPQPALDDDRAGQRRADPELIPDERGDVPRNASVVVDTDRLARSPDHRRQIVPVERPRAGDQRMCAAVVAFLGPRCHDGHRGVALVPSHAGKVRVEELPDLLHHRREQLGGRGSVCHQRCDAAQRRVLVRQGAVALLRLAQISLGLPPLGHVATDCVRQPFLDQRRCRPLDPSVRAIPAHVPVLERDGLRARDDLLPLRTRPLAVVEVDELEVGPRQRLLLGVAKASAERGVDAREIAVEACDDDQVGRHVDEAVRLVSG